MIRDVGLLMLARVAMSGVRALAGVIVPIYLTLIGFSPTRIGVLFAIVTLASALLTGTVGLLADRIGRKPFLIAFPLLAALAGLVFAVTRNLPLLFVFAALGSFGRGSGAGGGAIGPYSPAEQAFIADVTPTRVRNSVFGRIAFASAVGAVIGNSLAALPGLVARFGGLAQAEAYQLGFVPVVILALAAGLLAVPIANPKLSRAPRRERRRLVQLSRPSWSLLVRLWATNSVNGLAIGFVGPFITLWFYRRYGVGAGSIGLLYTVINIATMLSILSAANLAGRFGLVRTIVIGRTFQGLLLIPMVLMPNFWLAGLVYLVRMLAQRIAMPLRQSYVMAMVPPTERATVAGFSNLPSQGTSVLSPTPAGFLFEHVALALPFVAGAVLQVVNTGLYWLFFHNRRPPEELAPSEKIEGRQEAEVG